MSYINVILLIMSIIGLLISLLTLVKSIYIVIMRFIKIKKINKEEVRYKITNIEHCENIKEGNIILNDVYIMQNLQNLNNTYLTLVDSCSGNIIASIQQFPCIVGRGTPADVIIDSDKTISRRHVVFTYEKGRIFVNDLQSSNGTFINGSKTLSICEVKNGDIMKIGETQIRLIIDLNPM